MEQVVIERCSLCGKKMTNDETILNGRPGCMGTHCESELDRCIDCGNPCLKIYERCFVCWLQKRKADALAARAEKFHKCADCGKECLKTHEVCRSCYLLKKRADKLTKKEVLKKKVGDPDELVKESIIETIQSCPGGILSDSLMDIIKFPEIDVLGAIFHLRQFGKIRASVRFRTDDELHRPKIYYEIVNKKPKSKDKDGVM